MDFEIKEAIERQLTAWEQFRKANDSRLAKIDRDIDQLAKETAQVQLASQRPDGRDRGDTFGAEAKDFWRYIRTGAEVKSMSSGSDPEGGYLVPQIIDTKLSKYLRDFSPMRKLARVVEIDGAELQMVHSVGGTVAAWVGEVSARPETTSPAFQKISAPAHQLYALPMLSQALLNDNTFELEQWLLLELAETFGTYEGSAFLTGDGISKPRGILTMDVASTADGTRANTAVQYVVTGNSGAFAASNPGDKLFDLVHSLAPAYRQRAAWIMNSSVLSAIRQFKDGTTGMYLVRDGLNAGQPPELLGYPINEDENMPDLSANSLSIAFGDWQSAYTIVDRSTTLLRDPYSNKPYVGFYSVKRVGGMVRNTRAYKLMKFGTS